MRLLALIVVHVLAGVLCHGQSFADLPEPATYGSTIDVRTNIAFGEHDYQKLDLYLPAGASSAPIIVCWFGGAFWGSDRTQLASVAAYFAAHGFAAATPAYFLGTKDGSRSSWPRSVYDAKAAVRFVRANAPGLRVDPNRMVAFGYSSGAYLALMVGYTPNLLELEGPDGSLTTSSKVSAVIEVAGVCDRRRELGLPLGLLGRDYEDKYDLRVAASPIIYIGPNTVPTYILHGWHDTVADVSSATQLAAALDAAHVRHKRRLVDADHFPFNVEELRRMVEWLNKLTGSEASTATKTNPKEPPDFRTQPRRRVSGPAGAASARGSR